MTITIRPAPMLDSYRAPRRVFLEPDLLPIIRVEYCACGEYIRQLAGDSVTVTVQRHNAGHRHHTWRIGSSSGRRQRPERPWGVQRPSGASGRRTTVRAA